MLLYILAAIALVVIVLLSVYAWGLIKRLNAQKKAIQDARIERANRIKESIEIIAKAMKAGECNHSEGVIRLAMLFIPFGKTLEPYKAMNELYLTVQDMPTHEARKTLAKQERMRLDLTRESAEAKLEQEILLELEHLLNDLEKFGEL